MAKQELAVRDNFSIVTGYEDMDEDLKAELRDEMDDLDEESGISARKIKIPQGSSSSFEVEQDDPDDTESMKEIEGVILFTHRMNAWWEDKFGEGDNAGSQPPTCSAMDGKTGTNPTAGTSQICETCPHNQFRADGSGKDCKNMRRIYLLMSGQPNIYVLSVPPTSIKDINRQLTRIMAGAKIPYTKMVVRLTLTKAVNKGGIKYNKVVLEKAGVLPDAMAAKTQELRRGLKEQYKNFAITDEDYAAPAEAAAPPKADEDGFVQVDDAVTEALPFN